MYLRLSRARLAVCSTSIVGWTAWPPPSGGGSRLPSRGTETGQTRPPRSHSPISMRGRRAGARPAAAMTPSRSARRSWSAAAMRSASRGASASTRSSRSRRPTPSAAAEQTDELVEVATDELNELREIRPPDELREPYDRYLAARGRALELLEQGQDAAADKDADAYVEAQAEGCRGAARAAEAGARRRLRGVLEALSARLARRAAVAGEVREAERPSPGWRRRRTTCPALAPGRENAAERAQTMSVASSVPRSQASAHQSSGRPRRCATRWAAAKVSQIGPQRRNRCSASSEGSS